MFKQDEQVRCRAQMHVLLAASEHARLRQWILLVIALSLMQFVAACSLYTTRPINQANSNSQSNQFDQQFNPTTYTTSIWSSKVVPTILTKAVDIRTVLTALASNSNAAQKQYATQSSDGLYNFMVKGQGTVTAVNTSSRNGTLTIQLPAYSGQSAIILQIGPVVLGTSLRDSVGFISFSQFTNQVQYSQVADELNIHAVQDLQGINFATLQGKMITFYGAFTFVDLQQITIMPMKITPEGASG